MLDALTSHRSYNDRGSSRFSGLPPIHRWLVIVFLTAATLTLLAWWWNDHSSQDSFSLSTDKETATQTDLSLDDLKTLDISTVETMQKEAALHVGAQLDAKEFAGPVTARPAFISPVEWFVVKAVAAKSDDADKALTRLVNNFRFIKQMELWQAIKNGAQDQAAIYDARNVDKRTLAEHLLNSLPARVAAKDISPAQAQQVQMDLIMSIESDPSERRQRLRAEAQRIGVKFEIDTHE